MKRARSRKEAPSFLGLKGAAAGRRASRVLVWPVPYEATVSYGKGAGRGPSAILEASRQVERYDPEAGCEAAARFGVHTLAPARLDARTPAAQARALAREARRLARTGKLLCTLGGEHSISAAPIAALGERHPDLLVVHVDAHADLRASYGGTPHSHACAMRRALEALGGARLRDGRTRLVQIGLRNVSAGEERFQRRHRIPAFFMDERFSIGAAARAVREAAAGRPVYLSLDVDGLDPSIMPSTGTPEPDGLSWRDVLGVVRAILASGRLVGFDLVELAPVPGLHAPDFLAAKLAYKIMTLALGPSPRR